MSVKNDRIPPRIHDGTTKSLRCALKESHKNGNTQIEYNVDSKCNKLNEIINSKINANHKHNLIHNPDIQRHKHNNRSLPAMNKNNNNNVDPNEKWQCSLCTYMNLSIMKYCEICETPKNPNNNNNNNNNKETLSDEELARKLMLEESELIQQQIKKRHSEDEELAIKLHQQLNETQYETQKNDNDTSNTNDLDVAKKLQAELEARELAVKQKSEESDELMASRLQIEHERQLLKIEREKMENERAALLLQAKEECENAKYLERKKEQEEREKKDEEFAIQLQNQQEMDEKNVNDLFQHSLQNSRSIVAIEDISGNDKDEIYEKILSEKLKNCNKNTILKRDKMERYLWHGTKDLNNLKLIIKNGFDRSYNSASAYGKGTYFARDAAYSASGYCGMDSNGIYYILLCKVIVGDYTVGTQQTLAIPKKPDGSEYDSLVNNMADPSIFVIWRDYHACPAYLVKFR